MDKKWLKSYPAGIPAEIDAGEFRCIGDLFERSVAAFGSRVAFISMGRPASYAQMGRLARDFAACCQSMGLTKGARIALMLPNVLQYPVCLFGALRAGLTVVNCNPLYTPRELAHQLSDSGAEAIVVLESFAHVVQAAIGGTSVRHVLVTRLGDMLGPIRGAVVDFVVRHVKKKVPAWRLPQSVAWRAAMARGAAASPAPVDVGPDDIAFLQYTGGTTGVAKGAMLTHRNVVANLQQAHAWIRPFLREGEEIVITALPLCHIFALTANCLTFFRIGAANVLIANPRDIPAFVGELARHRFTAITGVSTLYGALLNHPDFAGLDFSRLRIALGGGMAVQRAVAERWQKVTGVPLIEAYGLTEASPAVAINPLDLTEFNGAIGLPIPSTEVAIRDDEGRDLPPGEPGELCVRGPQVMKGYWRRPEETAQVMMPDGFLRTGDVAVMDEKGFLRIVDRRKDMILVSGFNVYPNEVESVAMMHPGVLEAAAVGAPDPRTGEAVRLYVVRRDAALTAGMLIAHCRENLAPYKVPHRVVFCDELPKSGIGKVLRRALRDAAPPSPAG
ncbi:MAG: AMP-binding protein [Candidatus Nitricoxidivorans perseverans]|uniref:Long-chain-fatty-acid--CoA ligase n=1 Tax=Candidatus Nitricoxidivorans perseverans TaxID=2975601 RepID=A0AA49FMN5_9PROT|nr:MAG: AMP-binding protein [Candidatus Nitricoxidivorans perseverans]